MLVEVIVQPVFKAAVAGKETQAIARRGNLLISLIFITNPLQLTLLHTRIKCEWWDFILLLKYIEKNI